MKAKNHTLQKIIIVIIPKKKNQGFLWLQLIKYVVLALFSSSKQEYAMLFSCLKKQQKKISESMSFRSKKTLHFKKVSPKKIIGDIKEENKESFGLP